jgi:tetratricopeptide (TPR) repeat protein
MAAGWRARQVVWPIVILAVLGSGLAAYLWTRREPGLPAAGTAAYEQATRQFYRGLAALQVGLVDQAKQEFSGATSAAPGEPATWANLGLAHLRLGEFEAAAPAIERAVSLAPDHAGLVFLRGRLETSRGRRADGVALLRRAVALDEANLQARTALIQEIENAGGADADAEAQQLLEALATRQGGNVAVLIERARLAAKTSDLNRLRESVTRLAPMASSWPPEVVDQYRAVESAATTGDVPGAARALAFLRNVLARVPAFLEARRRVTPSAELIADPFVTFLRLQTPAATPSPIDEGLAYAREDIGAARPSPWHRLTTLLLDGTPPVALAADAQELRRVDAGGGAWSLTTSATAVTRAVLPLDWNHDFRMDVMVAGSEGVRLFVQDAQGGFADETARAWAGSPVPGIDATGVWAADVEMDGDLDIVVGNRGQAPMVLRNNGNGQWQSMQPFATVVGTRAFVWGDLDADGDPDPAMVDDNGTLQVFTNLQAGQFVAASVPAGLVRLIALALADTNADGVLDLVTLDDSGVLRRSSLGAGETWRHDTLVSWTDMPGTASGGNQTTGEATAGAASLTLGDVDNNGALDVVASRSSRTKIWLAGPDYVLRALDLPIDADVARVVDVTGDGQLDLIGLSAGRAVRFVGRSARAYHHQVIRPRAQTAAGDQRINSFGIGGEVEVRAGLLTQKQVITDAVVHVGLGTRTAVDVVRIVWPNGVPQAEFDPPVDGVVVAEQRLKGSCPWIFADNGRGMAFVTDFLWRSPLGLRINAQDTAGVLQTEDWVKIRGSQLVARDGAYDIRMSAELWETHFVDHIALMVVDHPADVEIFVDERFAPAAPPKLAVHAVRTPVPVRRAVDQAGTDVTDLVTRQDGRHLGTFARGQYQGVATDHFVEVDLAAPVPVDGRTWLVAHGWIYPTDSSINVAIGQGGHVQPRSLSLEAESADGRWVVVATDLGFPAGKNKSVLIDLSDVARAGVPGATRLRLRTNLEIYWDSIATATAAPDVAFRTTRLAASKAELRYRGFSQTTHGPREQPETPAYDRMASTMPRWRNLVGYYTRFGDVRPLLERVEDRYVIMNAGDELRLSFREAPPPAVGWARDFVLIGDGWVKDGDYNTSYAKTVLPLPTHASADYTAATVIPVLEQDPVYRRHAEDWQSFHTRFETAREFVDGLKLVARETR